MCKKTKKKKELHTNTRSIFVCKICESLKHFFFFSKLKVGSKTVAGIYVIFLIYCCIPELVHVVVFMAEV